MIFIFIELGITEHIEGDECKFAVWTGRAPMTSDVRIVLRANSLETKHTWVKKLREVIQETYFSSATLNLVKSPGKTSVPTAASSTTSSHQSSNHKNQRLSKDGFTGDELAFNEDHDVTSIASFGSGNTTDSEKVSDQLKYLLIYSKNITNEQK